MIFDDRRNLKRYMKLAPELWGKLEAFLDTLSADTAPGKYEIDGDRVYASVQHYAPHELRPEKLEYHRKFIDLQMVIEGHELLYFQEIDGAPVTEPYQPAKDVAFCRMTPDKAAPLPLAPGRFALLFAGEGHAPCIGDPATEVHKLVVKIDASLIG